MRNVIVLLVLVGILLGLTAVSRQIEDLHFIVLPSPGDVLYAATFDGFLEDWEIYEGRLSAQIEDGALSLAVDTANGLPFSAASAYFSDFDLRVRARPTAGPLNNGYGVIFRTQNPENNYAFLVSSDGYYTVQRRLEGQEKELSMWIESSLVNQGLDVDNWLRVVARGNRFQFYINGERVALCIPDDPEATSTYYNGECIDGEMQETLIDDSFDYGRIGVIAATFGEPNVEVEFDDLLVYGPEE